MLVYLLDVPLAIRKVQAELRTSLLKGIGKTCVAWLAYTAFYAGVATYLWRNTQAPS